ncbi:hypothetical protein ACN47E_006402 [Coniothyrium glycines]
MPRNGDGSSDNGPIEDQNIVHGNSGDATLQHAKNNVAPMPEIEKGEGIGEHGAAGVQKETPTGQGSGAQEKDATK